jgi:hypothetical protein
VKNTIPNKLNEVTISTLPIEIKVMTVGGKRLTLSVFNQIPERNDFLFCMTNEKRLTSYLGWVDKEVPFVLYNIESVLLKCSLKAITQKNNWDWFENNDIYKMSYDEFYLLASPFLDLKNQIYISI